MSEARKAAGSAGGRAQSPRQRARAARAKVLAAQRERERKIEDALTAAFDRQGAVRELQLSMEAADRDLAAAVALLAELGEGPQAIAAAMELPLKEVQRLLKLAEEPPAGDGAARSPADASHDAGVPAALAG
jgi:DNA-directed RNA polymerase specialized sigma24 family protein